MLWLMRLVVLAVMATVSASAIQSAQGTATPTSPPQIVYTARDGIAMPAVIYQEAPRYTEQGIRAKIQGFVSMEFVVEVDGSVGDVRIITPLDLGLDAMAVAALKHWRFRPATKDGLPVRARTNVVLSFSISGAPPPITVPSGFDAGPPSTATTWTREVVEANGVTISFAYPDGYERHDPPGAAIGASSATSLNSIVVSRPNPLPADLPFPLAVPELGRFSQTMRQQFAQNDKSVSIAATGQATIGSTNWLWLEMTGSLVAGLSDSAQAVLESARVWVFNVSVNRQLIEVMCIAPMLKDEAADVRIKRLDQIRSECSESLKRISLSSK
jgi:TonB family protein